MTQRNRESGFRGTHRFTRDAVSTNGETGAFGHLLRQARTAAAFSQEQLAERAGLSARGISDLERGLHRAPRLETVRMLADALAIDDAGRAALLAAARSAPAKSSGTRLRLAALPAPLTRLIGRERELETLETLLRDDTVRLLTLTGPGGSGKTRLAIAVAGSLDNTFVDGVAFVDLAPLADPALVLATVAQAVGLRDLGHQDLTESLRAFLGGKRVLLVLDNFEHLLEAATVVADLLSGLPALKILATSREPLRLRGEREFPVPPLALPDPRRSVDFDIFAENDAMTLLVERARDAGADFDLTAMNAQTVAEICRRLDGLPLALELAAAWIKILPPAALLARLEQRLPLLTSGARDLPPRLQTMRNAIAWSYDLLSDAEQALFRRLSVFVGDFSLESVAAVGDRTGDLAPVDGVASLVNKSLLRREGERDGEPRFRMLETVREFGRDQLADRGEERSTQEQHASWYLTLATRHDPLSSPAYQEPWISTLEAEYSNLQASLDWFLTIGEVESAQQLASALRPLWWVRSRLGEAATWFERVLAISDVPTRTYVQALINAGSFRYALGDCAGAGSALTRGRRLAEQLAADDWVAYALFHLAAGEEFAEGDYEAGRAHYEEGLAVARRTAKPFLTGLFLENLGGLYLRLGDLDKAGEFSAEALAVLSEIGDRYRANIANATLAWIDLERNAVSAATQRWEEALSAARELGDPWFLGNAFAGFAGVAAMSGDVRRAARLLGAAEEQRLTSGRSALPHDHEAGRIGATARAALGEAAFAAAWEEGRTVPIEQIIDDVRAVGPAALESRAAPPATTRRDRLPHATDVLRLDEL
jgi:predicted ATPase/DNA-binding XRE family transcriptional regulator